MTASATVQVIGLRALLADLRRMADDVNGPIYQALKRAGREAAEPVAGRTRSRVPHVSGDLAGTIRTSGARTGATVRMGGPGASGVLYAGWVEFGGTVGIDKSATRTYTASGHYLFPSAFDLRDVSARTYSDALTRALQEAGIWSNTGTDPAAVRD